MEDKTYGTLVTDCGIQLIAAAVMEGKKINITDLAVGDGGGSYYKPNSTMTALKGEKWRGKVNRVEINEKSPNMIDVNPSTMGNYDTAISGLIEHKEDTKIHVTAEEKASWTEGAEQAAADANRVTEALNAIAGIESRVSRVEDGLFNNITGNPFLASFDSLDGITLVKGIWNEERKRIEC